MSYRSNAAVVWYPDPQSTTAQPEIPLGSAPPPSLTQPLWRSLAGNLRDTFAPEKLPPLELTARPVYVGLALGERLRLPWFRTVFTNIGDVISPETLPPLELESQPVDVGELITDQLSHFWWDRCCDRGGDRDIGLLGMGDQRRIAAIVVDRGRAAEGAGAARARVRSAASPADRATCGLEERAVPRTTTSDGMMLGAPKSPPRDMADADTAVSIARDVAADDGLQRHDELRLRRSSASVARCAPAAAVAAGAAERHRPACRSAARNGPLRVANAPTGRPGALCMP